MSTASDDPSSFIKPPQEEREVASAKPQAQTQEAPQMGGLLGFLMTLFSQMFSGSSTRAEETQTASAPGEPSPRYPGAMTLEQPHHAQAAPSPQFSTLKMPSQLMQTVEGRAPNALEFLQRLRQQSLNAQAHNTNAYAPAESAAHEGMQTSEQQRIAALQESYQNHEPFGNGPTNYETVSKEHGKVTGVKILGTASEPNNPNANIAVVNGRGGWTRGEYLRTKITYANGHEEEKYIGMGGVQRNETPIFVAFLDQNGDPNKINAGGGPDSPLRKERAWSSGIIGSHRAHILHDPLDGDIVSVMNLGSAKHWNTDSLRNTGSIKTMMEGTIKSALNHQLDGHMKGYEIPLHDTPPEHGVTLAQYGLSAPKTASTETINRFASADAGPSGAATLERPTTPSKSKGGTTGLEVT